MRNADPSTAIWVNGAPFKAETDVVLAPQSLITILGKDGTRRYVHVIVYKGSYVGETPWFALRSVLGKEASVTLFMMEKDEQDEHAMKGPRVMERTFCETPVNMRLHGVNVEFEAHPNGMATFRCLSEFRLLLINGVRHTQVGRFYPIQVGDVIETAATECPMSNTKITEVDIPKCNLENTMTSRIRGWIESACQTLPNDYQSVVERAEAMAEEQYLPHWIETFCGIDRIKFWIRCSKPMRKEGETKVESKRENEIDFSTMSAGQLLKLQSTIHQRLIRMITSKEPGETGESKTEITVLRKEGRGNKEGEP